MKRLIIGAMFLASFGAIADQDKGMKDLNDAIVNARFAGTCGAYKQMADFQAATQMSGGDEFIERFGATEVARLGMTMPQLAELCEKAINNYNTMKRMSEK